MKTPQWMCRAFHVQSSFDDTALKYLDPFMLSLPFGKGALKQKPPKSFFNGISNADVIFLGEPDRD